MEEPMALEEFLIREGAPEKFDVMEFTINDDGQAIWAMRNLAKATRSIAEVERLAAEETAKIRAWIEYATKSARSTETYFHNALAHYMVRIREEGRKSLKLPDGDVTSRSTPAKAVVSDLGVFLKFAHDSGRTQWVRVKEEADLTAIRPHVSFDGDLVLDSDTGEVIEGLTHIEGDVSVSIKLSEV